MPSRQPTGDFVILCVCAGNIHRSALAESLLETWAEWYLPKDAAAHVRVESAGLIAERGVPMGEKARELAAALGARDRSRTATTLIDPLVANADIVLTATRRQADEIVRRVPAALRSTFTMREAGRVAEALVRQGNSVTSRTPDDLRALVAEMADRRHGGTLDEDDVIDPQGKGDEAYLQMAAQEVPALAAMAVVLLGMSRPDFDAYVEAASDPALLLERASGEPHGARW